MYFLRPVLLQRKQEAKLKQTSCQTGPVVGISFDCRLDAVSDVISSTSVLKQVVLKELVQYADKTSKVRDNTENVRLLKNTGSIR